MKRLRSLMLALAICSMCAAQAGAVEYTVEPPDDYLFGNSTSVDIIHREEEPLNTDRSKSVSLIPPGFGSPTSYLPARRAPSGNGEYLTPNLVPGALNGGLVPQIGSVNYPVAGTADVTGLMPGDAATFQTSSAPFIAAPTSQNTYTTAFTPVTSDLYYDGGYLATLKIPAIGVNVRVYEGTDSGTLAKGAGHFKDTSIWNGNVSVAGHNRGTNCYFGEIHTLTLGDEITLTTKLGTRTYTVTEVKRISELDDSDTEATAENCITLFTCVRNQSEYRWCVRAVER